MKHVVLALLLAWIPRLAIACAWNDWSFHSRFLPNPQSRVPVLTLLPPGFDPLSRYGVVYFLHGLDDDRNMLQTIDFCAALDAHVRAGGAPFIVVAPNGGNYYWMNGARNGIRMADVVTQELVRETDARFPTLARPDKRVIAGISMGGHGAIQISLNFPGIFGATAAHSPVFRTEWETYEDFPLEFGRGRDFEMRDPVSLVTALGKRLPGPVFFDIGGRDEWAANSIRFGRTLQRLGTPGVFHLADDAIGGHEIGYWRYHLPEYIRWYARQLSF